MKIKELKYKDFVIYYMNDKYLELGKDIINKNEVVTEEIKVTKRNYVVKINYCNEELILKAPRNEFRIPQRKLATLIKKGEARSTFENITKLIEEEFEEYIRPLLAIVKRKYGMIEESYIVFEFSSENGKCQLEDIIELGKKMHEKGIYHGDFNMSNFLFNDGIKIIDTQGKKYWFGKYRPNYDFLTLEESTYGWFGKEDWYNRDIWFYLAYFVKKIKRLKWVEKIKTIKKSLRDKGWKI